jgi:hypothetical protein
MKAIKAARQCSMIFALVAGGAAWFIAREVPDSRAPTAVTNL